MNTWSTSLDKKTAKAFVKKHRILLKIEVSNDALIKISCIIQFSPFSHEKLILLASSCILIF